MEMNKEIIIDQPPTYTEAIISTTPANPHPPAVGIIYPNASPYQGGFQPSAPPPVAPGYIPSYGTIDAPPAVAVAVPTEIIVIGGCPSCRIGFLEDSYSCLGLFCAIFFFPVGILCCLALKNKRCSNCGTEF